MRGPFTGKHMLAVLVGGFGIVVGVNLVMARAAISTFGGLVVENSYVASQNFNGWLEEAREVEALGWTVNVARKPDGRILIETAGVPAGVRVTADAWHPLGHQPDRLLAFEPVGAGSFVSTEALPAGRWLVRLEVSDGDKVWRGEQRLQ